MGLRAKKPEIKEARLKAVLYADKGAGKTHFCCSLPNTYYIDTEGLEDYPHLVKMLVNSGGDLVYLTDMQEIISEIKSLLSAKHDYKTVVIDSLSFPYAWLSYLEAERLHKKSPDKEGTEFSAHVAKSKRLTFHLGILLSRLDMNVIVISHERLLFDKAEVVGKTFDISDKLAYTLGTTLNLRLLGKNRKLFVEKSRYAELETGSLLDFNNGYETMKSLFGEEMFLKQSKEEALVSKDQLSELKRLLDLLKIDDDLIQKMLIASKAQNMEEMNSDYAQRCIDKLKNQAKAIEEGISA